MHSKDPPLAVLSPHALMTLTTFLSHLVSDYIKIALLVKCTITEFCKAYHILKGRRRM